MLIRIFSIVLCLLSPAMLRAEVLIFAAASLKEPLDALAAERGDVIVTYGGSGTLARQITQGAPADIVILANDLWMDHLVAQDFAQAGAVKEIARNRLVLVGAADARDVPLTERGLQEALGEGRIAVGLVSAVPAGIYAKAALTATGLWDAASPRLAEVDSVRAALALVERGQAPLGIVYATDARVSRHVRVLARFPNDSHPQIRYFAALLSDHPNGPAVIDALTGPVGQQYLADAGFLPPSESFE